MFQMNISPPSSGLESKLSREPLETCLCLPPASVDFLLCLLFNPEGRGEILGLLLTTQCRNPKYHTIFYFVITL
jgi:hypothetical protein